LNAYELLLFTLNYKLKLNQKFQIIRGFRFRPHIRLILPYLILAGIIVTILININRVITNSMGDFWGSNVGWDKDVG
jgi:hypothetical protein